MKPASIHRQSIVILALIGLLFLSAVALGCASASDSSAADELLGDGSADDLISSEATEVVVFYPSGDTLVEERAVVDVGGDLPFKAMEILFAGQPKNKGFTVSLPKAEVLSVRVVAGLATVDFDRKVLVTGETEQVQRVALSAILYTLRQFEQVEKVAITVEGRTAGKLEEKDIAAFWGDVRLSDAPWSIESTGTTGL